jgi:hypothetical protein
MARKPLLPDVIADRAKATEEYRDAQQAAIDRIAKLRAARIADTQKDEPKAARKTAKAG